ncbi:MAG: VTT domain-containing protein [Syntrophomonadaceae bacterium]|jgi:uncharacterized membrane protein YdjX (TVP38/TMEM64 family)|nr:VTT domain-containing protein [Syntrophomonadaceae bacterium]
MEKKTIPLIRILLIIALLALCFYFYKQYGMRLIYLIKDQDALKDYFEGLGYLKIPFFVILQMLQVVIAPLPGELFQFGAGYVFGAWLGALVSAAGIFLGSLLAFFISKNLGYHIVKNYIDPAKIEKWSSLMHSTRGTWFIFVIFLIPGLPKDIITFVAGITPIRWSSFFPPAIIGRMPGIFISSLVGAQVYNGNYRQAAVIITAITVLLLISIIFRNKILILIRN